jgi:hypothetical protein
MRSPSPRNFRPGAGRLVYSKELGEPAVYVVSYALASGVERGYVYLPGRSDEWWRLNVSSIIHGVEGQWFRAWSRWEAVARPLIKRARRTGG